MAASALESTRRPPIDTHMSRMVFAVAFVVFLAIALVAQVLFMHWRDWLPGAEGQRGLIGGVTSAVYTFMSYIP
jgi:light-harvesting complex 1 beta chain